MDIHTRYSSSNSPCFINKFRCFMRIVRCKYDHGVYNIHGKSYQFPNVGVVKLLLPPVHFCALAHSLFDSKASSSGATAFFRRYITMIVDCDSRRRLGRRETSFNTFNVIHFKGFFSHFSLWLLIVHM